MKYFEVRAGDIRARAGLIITDGQYLLAGRPTPSSRWPDPDLDIPKGHIQKGESPMAAAIRECHEETNILFEPWKLSRHRAFVMDGEPLYLWEVWLSEMPPIEKLSCVSTFVDDATGLRHPEMAGYEYITKNAFGKLQSGLQPCVRSYFEKPGYPFEDRRICADKINLPNGIYRGIHSVHYIQLANGVTFKTVGAIHGGSFPCIVEINKGFVYWKERA